MKKLVISTFIEKNKNFKILITISVLELLFLLKFPLYRYG